MNSKFYQSQQFPLSESWWNVVQEKVSAWVKYIADFVTELHVDANLIYWDTNWKDFFKSDTGLSVPKNSQTLQFYIDSRPL
jgi:hypothetical protein